MHQRRVVLILTAMFIGPALRADDPPSKPETQKSIEEQARLEERYREFESVLGRMSDLMRTSDPDRAALLAKAFGESKKELVAVQLRELKDLLEKGDFNAALKDQEDVLKDMQYILEMLLSEDRAERLRKKRERMEKYLKEVQGLLDRQKSIRSQTERSGSQEEGKNSRLSQSQGKLAEDTGKLDEKIEKEDQEAEAPEDQADSSGEPKNQEGQEGKQSPGEQSKEKQGDQSSGQSAKNSKSQPSPGSPSNSPGSESKESPDSEATPGRKNLQEAQRAMQEAKKQLEELKKQEASKEQDRAIKELEKTIEELEEVLRQLREEERQELLANLESRLRQLLDIQTAVHEGTLQLSAIPEEKRSRADLQRALGLSRREESIVGGLDQVLVLLNEDGTAVAFPETIEQVRADAESVVKWLARGDVGQLTQRIEQDIIDTLEEMIEAIQKEMQSDKGKKQDSQPGGGASRQPLVEKIAELKMIRSLQKRVNERTQQISELSENEGGVSEAMAETIRELAERQHRVYEITRDIAQGKNE